MGKSLLEWKATLSACIATCTAVWGWFGWLMILWLICLCLDFLTGSLAASAEGAWSSQKARRGIWHKVGAIVAVMVAAVADLLLGMVAANVPDFPLAYSTFLCPMVLIWYTLTELGSILENALRLGAPVPAFLKKALNIHQEK